MKKANKIYNLTKDKKTLYGHVWRFSTAQFYNILNISSDFSLGTFSFISRRPVLCFCLNSHKKKDFQHGTLVVDNARFSYLQAIKEVERLLTEMIYLKNGYCSCKNKCVRQINAFAFESNQKNTLKFNLNGLLMEIKVETVRE